MLHRREWLSGVGVKERLVALAERPAHGVLAGDANRDAVQQQRAEGESFGVPPLNPPVLVGERIPAPGELLLQLGAERELGRESVELRVHRLKRLAGDRGLRFALGLMRQRLSATIQRGLGRLLADRCLSLRQSPRQRLCLGGGVLGRDDAIGLQSLEVEIANARMLRDSPIHRRLGVGGLVRLVVAVAPIADQVDDHVTVELGAVQHRQSSGSQAGLRVVRVDVHDGHVESLRQV